MANRRVTIWRYTKIDGKWKYLKPTYGRNNKIKPEEGAYYIRWIPRNFQRSCNSNAMDRQRALVE